MEEGRVKKGDGRDVDHRKPLIKGGSNDDGNLHIVPQRTNRSFPRTRRARMK